jgi:pimeloyl-ACP methyl ester carboxylesterase
MRVSSATTSTLEIWFEESGPPSGPPVVLMHGFPYSVRGYDAVVDRLAAAGCRCIVPHLRGFGPTRFLESSTMRSGQQAALADDLRELLDALQIDQAVLGGFDWGGRAACIVAALWPQRCLGLVTCGGYNVQDIAASVNPGTPQMEHADWYQYYFHTERGRAGLAANRRKLAHLLWRLWSPLWQFDEATFDASASVLGNADFVDVVIHSYRHRYGYAPGDPDLEAIERALAEQPPMAVPTISLDGNDGAWGPADCSEGQHAHFVGAYEQRVLPGVGHNVPQEAPHAFASAVLDLL